MDNEGHSREVVIPSLQSRTKYTKELYLEILKLLETLPPEEVASKYGMTRDALYQGFYRKGITVSGLRGGKPRKVLRAEVGTETCVAYVEEAFKRGMNLDTFVCRILVNIAKDDLFNAVLDDKQEGKL